MTERAHTFESHVKRRVPPKTGTGPHTHTAKVSFLRTCEYSGSFLSLVQVPGANRVAQELGARMMNEEGEDDGKAAHFIAITGGTADDVTLAQGGK